MTIVCTAIGRTVKYRALAHIHLADDARFSSGRPDSQPVLGTHVDDSGNESFINRFNLSQKTIGLGLTALAGLVIILVAVTGPSFREVTDPILVFVSLWRVSPGNWRSQPHGWTI